jgi:AAA ATPase domain
MEYLFIDNFRGFSETYIPIRDVNFLVGENSTGKTSVLGLLKLISSPQFLLRQGFGDEHVSFGNFSDMVSAHASDRTYFHIGFVWEEIKGKKDERPAVALLLTYREHEGLPRLWRSTFSRGSRKVSLHFVRDTVRYRVEKFPKRPRAAEIVSASLPQWVREHSSEPSGYEKLVTPRGLPPQIPFLMALSLVPEQTSAPQANDESATFEFPDIPFPMELTWVAPIRTKPRRTYDELSLEFSPEGTHTPYLIRRLLHTKSAASRFRDFIQKVGSASGLFQSVQIKNLGRGATAPFEVDIVLDGKALNVSTVGYGVSQSLPVLVEVLARQHGSRFAIQQPEVHLHPRAQAMLGDIFFEMAVREHKNFLVETHSDFTIDRFRMNYKREKGAKPDSQILFFERKDSKNTVTPLRIGDSGELPSDQPSNYRQFFVKEELRLLEI